MADKEIEEFSLLPAPIPDGAIFLVQSAGTTYGVTKAALLGSLCAAVAAHLCATAAHGVTGDIVGTTDTQNLDNKTFVGALAVDEVEVPYDGAYYFRQSPGVNTEWDWRLIISGQKWTREFWNGTAWVPAAFDSPIPLE